MRTVVWNVPVSYYQEYERLYGCPTLDLYNTRYYLRTFTDTKVVINRPKTPRSKPETLWNNPTPLQRARKTTKVHGYETKTCSYAGWYSYQIWQYYAEPPSAVYTLAFDERRWSDSTVARIQGLSTDLSGTIAEIDEAAELVSTFANMVSDLVCCLKPGPKCLRTLRNYAKKYRNAMRKWVVKPGLRYRKSRDYGAAFKSVTQEISGDVLAFDFGVLPLVSTMYDLSDSIGAHGLDADVKLKRLTHRQKYSKTYIKSGFQITETLTVKAVAYVKFKTPYRTFVSQGNPAEWIWERIPFSFVFDWITNVGSYIAYFGALENVESVVGTFTEVRTFDAFQVEPQGVYTNHLVTSGFTKERTHQRFLLPQLSPPMMLGPSGNDSTSSLFNAVTLLTQRLTSARR